MSDMGGPLLPYNVTAAITLTLSLRLGSHFQVGNFVQHQYV